MNYQIQGAVATKEGNQYKVVFQKGTGFADFVTQIKTVHHKKCWGSTTHKNDEFTNRNPTDVEIAQIKEAIKNKIGISI